MRKSDRIQNIQLIMTVIRPLVNVDEWSYSAKCNTKGSFLSSAGEPTGGQNTHRIAQHLRKKNLKIQWEDLLDAYMALVNEFADWYYSALSSDDNPTNATPKALRYS